MSSYPTEYFTTDHIGTIALPMRLLFFAKSLQGLALAIQRQASTFATLQTIPDAQPVIATSGPSSTYPQRAYRNPTDALVKFLDHKHDRDWAIWEFRAEGTGYPDSEVYDRIHHYPWPDHHPPPFSLIPNIMASMRNWLKDPQSGKERVVVVHCKAGKGRSGTVACSYLISQEGWTVEDALTRFTARRMRSGFGNGISIPSQLRWVGYVDYWSRHRKIYVERNVEILEVHVWGMRDGVEVAIAGYVEQGKLIKTFHTFANHERTVMESTVRNGPSPTIFSGHLNEKPLPLPGGKPQLSKPSNTEAAKAAITSKPGAVAVVLRPAQPIILPTSDVNIDFERRNKTAYGFTMVTSVAHVWFNTFFESQHSSTASHDFTKPVSNFQDPPVNSSLPDSGVFEIAWEAMDGIKGSAHKGTRALDRLAVVWRAVPDSREGLTKVITEPAMGEPIPDSEPADWTKANQDSNSALSEDLGLRTDSPSGAYVSRASSTVDIDAAPSRTLVLSATSIQTQIPADKETTERSDHPAISISEPTSLGHGSSSAGGDGPTVDLGLKKVKSPSQSPAMVRDRAAIIDDLKAISTGDLGTAEERLAGQIVKDDEPMSS